MADIIHGGAVEALILAMLKQRPPALADDALLLLVCEPGNAEGTGGRWVGQCGVGLDPAAIRAIKVPSTDADHPVAATLRAAREERAMASGIGMDERATPLAGKHWLGVAIEDVVASNPIAVLLAFGEQPWGPLRQAAIVPLATQIGAVIAGAEAALRERRESDQLALLMRYAANPIILSDAQTIISMNEPALRLFDIAPAADAEAQGEFLSAITRNLAKLRAFLAEVSDDPNTVHTSELTLEDPHTQEELVMAVASSHVPEALGGASGAVSVLHDMTRSRELETHRVRQQLFESEKLAATGRLAASIAHEINNPLEAIKNSLYLLVRQTEPDNPNRQFLELAQRETERVSRIIRQMLGVSRPSVAFAPVDVNEVLQEALQLLGPQLRQGKLTPTIEFTEHLPQVMASTDQLKQVFLNLLLNAKEAMPQGGGLLVQTRLAHEGDAEFLAGKHVIVRIRDDGAGIPSDILPHVFEPFFSTKTERHGTGLGLWVCQDIIQSHGGHILVRSMVGKGTTFLVALPFVDDPTRNGGSPT